MLRKRVHMLREYKAKTVFPATSGSARSYNVIYIAESTVASHQRDLSCRGLFFAKNSSGKHNERRKRRRERKLWRNLEFWRIKAKMLPLLEN